MGDKMTREEQEEIKSRRKAIEKRLDANGREHERIIVDLKALQDECSHPNARPISHQGERATYCPLCGWES
jgi:hypothetical protein